MSPCRKCGGSKRYKHGDCVVCTKARTSAYYQAHREEKLASAASYRATNRERLRAYFAAYQKARRLERMAGIS